MKEYLENLLDSLSFSAHTDSVLAIIIILLGLLIIAVIGYVVFRKILLYIAHNIADKSKTHWDDMLYNNSFFHKLSHIIPAVFLYISIPLFFDLDVFFKRIFDIVFDIYFIVVFVRIINAILDTINDIHNADPKRNHKSIKSYVQLAKIVVYTIAIFLSYSIITDESLGKIILGLGTFAALLILVFQDTIKGLVSGAHLAANDMIRIGDWVSVPKYEADGVVLEVTLTTVKVQNWDKTISMVPTYALFSGSFSNWRGMEESGGRRIKRSVNIDISSVRFLTDSDRQRLSQVTILKDYILEKNKEVAKQIEIDYSNPTVVNDKHLTNLGIFRKYLQFYLNNHPDINHTMTCMVRQMQSEDKGIPMEIYCFSSQKAWELYEGVQADIFDHIFAVAKHFDLRIFQNPTGSDFKQLAK